MTLQEVDKKISELHILRKSLEKMEIRKFQEKAKKNVGRCFILNGNYLRIIDIPREQALLREHEVIVFQHPLYTYSCPALLKEWLDRVLSRGFASGPGGNQLAGKYWRSVITTGEPESAYRYDALNRYPMSDVLRPFELAAGMCRMHWLSPIIIYWARRQSAQELASHARAYGDWLANPLSPGGR